MTQHFNQAIPFIKMHGAGNDFVIIDARKTSYPLREKERQLIAKPRFGVGCDQIVIMENSAKADVFMRLYNSDGGEVSACGNATRCVAWLLMEETGKTKISVETKVDVLIAERAGDFAVKVDMGVPKLNWDAIPLAEQRDTKCVDFPESTLTHGVAVNMGNPHIVFFVDTPERVPLELLGPKIEHHPLFPERTNVELTQLKSREHIIVRVWERGAGETLACGTGACAAMVAAHQHGHIDDKVTVSLAGGDLIIEWDGKGTVKMTGPTALVYKGEWLRSAAHS